MKQFIKILPFIAIAVLWISCNEETPETNVQETNVVPLADTVVPFWGIWASEKYIRQLITTTSPNKSQEDGYFYSMPASVNASGYTYVYHEGGLQFHLVKHDTDWYILPEGQPNDSVAIVFIDENKFSIKGEVFVKTTPDCGIPEDLLLRGDYIFNDTPVVITSKGEIKGLSNTVTFEVVNDYYGPGFGDLDMLYLGKNRDLHVFNISKDTLFIYSVKCMEKSENGDCNDIHADKLKYRFIRRK